MKKCKKCKQEKELIEFHKHSRYKDGYRNTCKACRALENKIYYTNNSNRIRKTVREYVKNNAEKLKRLKQTYNKRYNEKNKGYYRKYREKNKEKLNKQVKERAESCPVRKLIRNCRCRIREFVKQNFFCKKSKSIEMIGCSPQELRKHLESQFQPGMTWENYGLHGWHIDHIIPVSSAKTPEEARKLCHYTNLQPLWAKDNLIKGNKLF